MPQAELLERRALEARNRELLSPFDCCRDLQMFQYVLTLVGIADGLDIQVKLARQSWMLNKMRDPCWLWFPMIDFHFLLFLTVSRFGCLAFREKPVMQSLCYKAGQHVSWDASLSVPNGVRHVDDDVQAFTGRWTTRLLWPSQPIILPKLVSSKTKILCFEKEKL